MNGASGSRRAFLTCSARARGAVGPILDEAEALLHELGWRSRLPLRPAPGSVSTDERRRVREQSYQQVETSQLVLHVPSPQALSGTRLNRELNHAVRRRRPVCLLLCTDLRERHGIGLPDPDRLEELTRLADGRVLERLDQLSGLLQGWPAALEQE